MIHNTLALILVGFAVSAVLSLPLYIPWIQKRIDRRTAERLFSSANFPVVIAFGVLAGITFIFGPVWMYQAALFSIGVLIGRMQTRNWFMKQWDRQEQHSA